MVFSKTIHGIPLCISSEFIQVNRFILSESVGIIVLLVF